MLFLEKKLKKGFQYYTEDVFGTVEIKSDNELGPDILDGIIGLLLNQSASAKTIEGEVKVDKSVIKYKFIKAPSWGDEEKTCDDTHISIPKQEKGFTRILRLLILKLSWFSRFVGAFREAWKKEK